MEIRGQTRGRRIAMTPTEVDAFLTAQRTCRVATVGRTGPHVTPMWFFWDGAALWLNSVVASRRWTDLARDPRVAVVVDDGDEYRRLRGVEITGEARPVGEVPRSGTPDPALERPELGFHRKYRDASTPVPHDGRHAWLRVEPRKTASWDFRKIGTTGRHAL